MLAHLIIFIIFDELKFYFNTIYKILYYLIDNDINENKNLNILI